MARRERDTVRHRLTVALPALLLLATPAMPQAPAAAARGGDEPVFNPLETNAAAYAGLAVGTAAGPALPAVRLLGAVYGGAHPDLRVWSLEALTSSRNGRALLATATLVPMASSPGTRGLTALALCQAGDQLDCWVLVNTDEVRPIPKSLLSLVRDEKPIAVGMLEVEAYTEVLVLAGQTSNRAFERAAQPGLTYKRLFNAPARHRGEVARFEGRLRLVEAVDVPEEAMVRGVRTLYEGWMFDPEVVGANPVCILFTDLPPGIRLGEKIDRKVSFAGYFFKRYRYKARDSEGNQRRDAPLLIGRTVTLLDQEGPAGPQAEASDGWATNLLPLFLGLVGGTVTLVIALTVWFRRTDSRIHRRVAAARLGGDGLVLPPPEQPPVPEREDIE